MASVHDVIKELIHFKTSTKSETKNENSSPSNYFEYCEDKLIAFVSAQGVSLQRLNHEAKQLKLVKTVNSRNKTGDRIGYGLSKTISKMLDPTPPRTFFIFGKSKKTGLYNASEGNLHKLELYNKYAVYCHESMKTMGDGDGDGDDDVVGIKARSTIFWRPSDADHLIRSRSQINPPTFRAIANELNMFYERTGV